MIEEQNPGYRQTHLLGDAIRSIEQFIRGFGCVPKTIPHELISKAKSAQEILRSIIDEC